MSGRQHRNDEAINPSPDGDPAPGLEGLPRADIGALEASLPSLVERAIAGPLVLTRHGTDAFVLLPLDVWRRHWVGNSRPPVVEGVAEED